MKKVFFAVLMLLSTVESVHGDIVFDHTQFSSLVVEPNLPNFADTNGLITSIVTIPITENYNLSKVGFLFGTQDGSGNANAGSLSDVVSWRIGYYPTLSDLQTNPFGQELSGNAQFVDLFQPLNAGWEGVVGSKDGYDLRYAEFSVNFAATPGSFISAFAQIDSPQLRIGTPYSQGGDGTIGLDPSWVATNLINGGTVASLSDLGAPFSYGAFKIEATAVPEPSTGITMLLASLLVIIFKRKNSSLLSLEGNSVGRY